jgi:hypothetical protein
VGAGPRALNAVFVALRSVGPRCDSIKEITEGGSRIALYGL